MKRKINPIRYAGWADAVLCLASFAARRLLDKKTESAQFCVG